MCYEVHASTVALCTAALSLHWGHVTVQLLAWNSHYYTIDSKPLVVCLALLQKELFKGAVLLAPMLSLEKVSKKGCNPVFL